MNINLTLVIQGLAFFATAWLVMKFGWPHIIGAIEERQKKISDGLAAAEEGKRALASASAKAHLGRRSMGGGAQPQSMCRPPRLGAGCKVLLCDHDS